ncbi:LITAF domain-containing protein-like [Glandiceps talaboti]
MAYPGQQAPPPPYQSQMYSNNTVVVANQPAAMTMVNVVNFGSSPVSMTCPHCRQQIVSSVYFEVGTMAWLICFFLWFVGAWCCCFIPFCMDSCKDAVHKCPSCNNHLGTYSRM